MTSMACANCHTAFAVIGDVLLPYYCSTCSNANLAADIRALVSDLTAEIDKAPGASRPDMVIAAWDAVRDLLDHVQAAPTQERKVGHG